MLMAVWKDGAFACGGLPVVFDAIGQAALTLPYTAGCTAAAAFNP